MYMTKYTTTYTKFHIIVPLQKCRQAFVNWWALVKGWSLFVLYPCGMGKLSVKYDFKKFLHSGNVKAKNYIFCSTQTDFISPNFFSAEDSHKTHSSKLSPVCWISTPFISTSPHWEYNQVLARGKSLTTQLPWTSISTDWRSTTPPPPQWPIQQNVD